MFFELFEWRLSAADAFSTTSTNFQIAVDTEAAIEFNRALCGALAASPPSLGMNLSKI